MKGLKYLVLITSCSFCHPANGYSSIPVHSSYQSILLECFLIKPSADSVISKTAISLNKTWILDSISNKPIAFNISTTFSFTLDSFGYGTCYFETKKYDSIIFKGFNPVPQLVNNDENVFIHWTEYLGESLDRIVLLNKQLLILENQNGQMRYFHTQPKK